VTFEVPADAYDRFMGRFSEPLALKLADLVAPRPGQSALDVGCGPGALTAVLVDRLGAGSVAAVDPSETFVTACRERNPGVEVRQGVAETLPFDDRSFDGVLAQLVLHFVGEPEAAAAEMRRVLRTGGVAAACVWDFGAGMRMLRSFWDAARAVDPSAPDEAGTMRFGRDGEIAALLIDAGFGDVASGAVEVHAAYDGFDDLWGGFLGGAGPAGAYCASLDPERRERLRRGLQERLGAPDGPFTLAARAWYARGRR
jgi:SAM-dependent methyltransferase